MPLKPGTILENRYRVDSLLGQGGMGAVYRARDERLAMWVALKENSLNSPEARAQFVREAQVLARLHHSNLPKVIDHFITKEGLQYLVMTFIEGVNLADLLASRGRQSPAEVMTWLRQVCDALTYLHSQNPPIIHRDIKPQNIKITPDGRVFLVDFGLSKVGSIQQSTASGALGVTPGFSPWEQYGQGHTDQRSDVYALTATLYAMLTGEIPPDSVRRGLAGVPLRSPREFNPGLSPTFERALVHGLETQPTNRPASVAALCHELEVALNLPNRAAPVSSLQAAPPTGDVSRPLSAPVVSSTRRERGLPWWALIGVAATAVVLVVIGVAAIGGRKTSTATPPGVVVNTGSPATTRTVQPAGATLAAPLALVTLLPTATSLPTSTAPPPTATPLPTATPVPTSTATVTAAPTTPTPVVGKVVFGSDRSGYAHIFTARGNGQGLRAITSGSEYFWDPIFSNDGTLVAFVSKVSGNTEVFVARSDGSNARAISNHPAEDDHPAWFPRNGELAFASRRNGGWDIYRMNADGSNVRRLTADGGDNRFVSVSPDGRQIAYVSQNAPYPGLDLMLMNADGSNRRILFSFASTKQRDDPGRYVFRPDWSPDGAQLAFGADDDSDGLISVFVVEAATGQARRLIEDGNSPAWSPDGGRLIYKPAGERQILFVADASGRRLYQLTGSAYNAWSPDWAR
ncbi:protein kinase domain-containing protein [Candidatus Amarolinea aalborgensis]|jgi:Tol biopolymer transport system component/predicted Ser/Thr protein kinase|uniref:protein kinase domain-containing protein n=1 Tax=Candidatus Amarolinea aalborgensis TaxID=2249329 RepID=UPI003BF9FB52